MVWRGIIGKDVGGKKGVSQRMVLVYVREILRNANKNHYITTIPIVLERGIATLRRSETAIRVRITFGLAQRRAINKVDSAIARGLGHFQTLTLKEGLVVV